MLLVAESDSAVHTSDTLATQRKTTELAEHTSTPATRILEETMALSLPIELVLDVLESAALNYRDTDRQWSLSLSLVSRTVRGIILPIVYEVLVIAIESEIGTKCVGWNGREYSHPQLAFLSWLLHEADAPPRQHVKHLIFRHDSDFFATNIGRESDDEDGTRRSDNGMVPLRWEIDYLTVRYRLDATELFFAGIRPAHAFRVSVHSRNIVMTRPHLDLAGLSVQNNHGSVSVHRRFWTSQTTYEGRQRRVSSCAVFAAMDPGSSRMVFIPMNKEDRAAGRFWSTMELGSENGAQELTSELLEEIANLLETISGAEVTLSCGTTYTAAGGVSVEQFIRNTQQSKLVPHLSRLKVARGSSWDFGLMSKDIYLAFARAVHSGRDIWDRGHPIVVQS